MQPSSTQPKRLVARWETKGRDYLELLHDHYGYYFKGNDCGGSMPSMPTDQQAIEWMEKPWGFGGAGPVTVLREDRSSLKRVV